MQKIHLIDLSTGGKTKKKKFKKSFLLKTKQKNWSPDGHKECRKCSTLGL